MAKWKPKFASKIFTNKKNESHEKQNNNDYFHNIVPPISNNLDNFSSNRNSSINVTNNFDNVNNNINNENKKDELQKVHDIKNVQVTSSFIIPLNENLKQTSSRNNNFFDNTKISENNMNTMALVSFKNNFKIPKALSFEIKIEKLKQLIISLLSLIVIIISSIFIGFWFSKLNLKYIPHPILTITLLILSLTILSVNLIDFFSLKKEINLYIEKTLKGSLMPPNFIIRSYRRIHGQVIIFNWLFSFCYIIFGLIALIMYLISGQKLTFLVQSWTVVVPNLSSEAVTLTVLIVILFFVHMLNFVFFKKRKSNIISYYGYEVVSPTDLEIYKKKINRICMIITISFIAIIFFAVAIPILVARKRKKKT